MQFTAFTHDHARPPSHIRRLSSRWVFEPTPTAQAVRAALTVLALGSGVSTALAQSTPEAASIRLKPGASLQQQLPQSVTNQLPVFISSDQMTSNAIVTCSDASNKTYTFPRFNVLGSTQNSNNPDGAGTYTLQVSDIIPNTNIINAVATFQHEVATIITAALLEYYTFGLISAQNIPLSTFIVESCDVQLTVFRENGYNENLPDGVGGFIVGSTSDTVTFRFVP